MPVKSRIGAQLLPEAGALQTAARKTLTWIDAIHLGPELPTVPVRYYEAAQPFGHYTPGDGRPDSIGLSLYGPHPHLTLAHEVGHLLDQALIEYTGYASESPASELRDVMQVIAASDAAQNLQTIVNAAPSQSSHVAVLRAKYWLQPAELWARAYAQFIVVRSGATALQEELQITLGLEAHSAARWVQWAAEAFTPIEAAITAAFRQKEWMR